jgi:hypothetical protein
VYRINCSAVHMPSRVSIAGSCQRLDTTFQFHHVPVGFVVEG